MTEYTQFSFKIVSSAGEKTVVANALVISVGRAASNDIVLDDDAVSSQHLTLAFNGQHWEVTDLGSTNGTQLGNIALKPGRATEWLPGITLCLGASVFHLQQASERVRSWVNLSTRWQQLFTPVIALLRYRTAAPIWLILLSTLLILLLIAVLVWRSGSPEPETVPRRATPVPTFTPTAQGANAATGVVVTATFTPTPLLITPSVRTPVPGSRPTSTPAPISRRSTVNIVSEQRALAPFSAPAAAGASLIQAATSIQNRVWDARLDRLGVTLQPAQVAPGQAYWRLIEARWASEAQAGGTHHIYVELLDENQQRVTDQTVTITWGDGAYTGHIEAKPPTEFGFNYMMYAAGWAYRAQVDGLPSDVVQGMGLGSIEQRQYGIHVSYYLTYQRTIQ